MLRVRFDFPGLSGVVDGVAFVSPGDGMEGGGGDLILSGSWY